MKSLNNLPKGDCKQSNCKPDYQQIENIFVFFHKKETTETKTLYYFSKFK